MYESGYGGDKADIYGGGYNAQEEELRRKREQQQQPMQQQAPYQQQDTKPQQPAQQSMQPAQQQQQAQQAQALQQQQKTFAELQQAGQARPAPPQAQPPAPQQAQQVQALQQVQQQPMQQYYGQQVGAGGAPVGLDPIAMMAGGQQNVAQYLQQMQQREATMPGSTMLANQTGEYNPWEGQYGDGSRMMGSNMAASSTPPQPGAFTGDLGGWMAGQMNAPAPTYNLPTQMAATSAPTFDEDPMVRAQIEAMNTQMARQGGYVPGALSATAGSGDLSGATTNAADAVSSAGVNPLAAAGAGGTSTNVTATSTSRGPVGGADVRNVLSQALANPSAFDNEQVMNLYGRLGQNIDDQFAQEDTRLREEMAARGLSDSSIMGGRLSDLNVGRRQARTELANQLGIQRAQDFANARNAAIGLGLQQAGQDNSMTMSRENNALQGRGLDLQANNQAFNQRMGGLQFQNQLGQQRFGNQMDSTRLNAQLQGQRFGQGMDLSNFGLGANQQGYNQRMGMWNALNNFGQQAFNNDLATAQFNAGQQSQGDQFLMSLLGLGG